MQETWNQTPGGKEPPEEEIATCSSILAWRIPWTEEPGGLQSIPCSYKRVRHDLATKQQKIILSGMSLKNNLKHKTADRLYEIRIVWFNAEYRIPRLPTNTC